MTVTILLGLRNLIDAIYRALTTRPPLCRGYVESIYFDPANREDAHDGADRLYSA
jgi:hypothetical protein